MATQSPNNFSTLCQTQPDTLPKLVWRLRDHAKKINNRACQAMSQDMLLSALVIERDLVHRDIPTDMLVGDMPADAAIALAQMARHFVYEDAERFSNRSNGAAERDALLDGIDKLRSALAAAGFAPC
jgi:hypothetical protein